MSTLETPALPAIDHTGRRDRLRRSLDAAEVASFVVTAPTNVRYLTGFTGSNGQVLILPDETVLVTDGRYEEQAGREASGVTVVVDRTWIPRVADLARAVDGRLAFESAHLDHGSATALLAAAGERSLATLATDGLVEEQRTVKDEHELAALTHACAITDATFAGLLDEVRPGVSELALARWLERTMEDLGAEERAFRSIVASGPNSAVPHHQPSGRLLQAGELLKVDFGARYAGYHADMTRTVSLGEPADAELVEVHALVQASQAAGTAAITGATDTGVIDAACRDLLTAAGYGERFVHGTGHGVGLDIHEAPWVGSERSGSLPAGTVITVEPGVYLPGRGGVRIEDTVAVTADRSPRCLTTSPRDLLRL